MKKIILVAGIVITLGLAGCATPTNSVCNDYGQHCSPKPINGWSADNNSAR